MLQLYTMLHYMIYILCYIICYNIVINDINKATHQGYQPINLSELSPSLVDHDYVYH